MPPATETAAAISRGFEAAGCEATLHAVALSSGAQIGLRPDVPMVMASVFKPLVALEFYAQSEAGLLDPTEPVEVTPVHATPGPVGLSIAEDPARLSLRDLARLMLTVSDNAATDILTRRVGLERVNARARACGCDATVLGSDLATMLDGVAAELGWRSYGELIEAQSGRLGADARARSTDPARLDRLAALDPQRASRTTARDMTTLLAAVWADTGAAPEACRRLRQAMSQQVTRRLEPATPDGGGLAAKSGGLFGRVRNEIGVITWPGGEHYAVAVFTRARHPFVGAAAINAQIGEAARLAIAALRSA
ncbi:MAG TPA: serine hydrolase [Phenylobacterium sp.]|nr:serine hydrolase [Phenylobacterium sp.]